MRLRIGDRVRVRPDIADGAEYGFMLSMGRMANEMVTIQRVRPANSTRTPNRMVYRIAESSFNWGIDDFIIPDDFRHTPVNRMAVSNIFHHFKNKY